MPRISDLSQAALDALTEVSLARMELDAVPAAETRRRNRARERLSAAFERLALVLSIERNAVLAVES